MFNFKKHKPDYDQVIKKLGLDDVQENVLRTIWLDYLLLMNKSAQKGWCYHNFAQVAVILTSLSIPIIEKTKLNANIFNWDLSLLSLLGLFVAAVTALNRQFAFEEKWRHYRFSAESDAQRR